MLHEFQQAFAAMVSERGPSPAFPGLRGSPRRQALGLRVYRNNAAHARLCAIRDTYPVVAGLIGEARLTESALAMAVAWPVAEADPVSWALQFPEFLAGSEMADEAPWLADIARIEAAVERAAGAADAPPPHAAIGDAERLSKATIRLATGTAALPSQWPAYARWARHHGHTGARGNACVVFRCGLAVEVRPAAGETVRALGDLGDGGSAAGLFGRVDDVDAPLIGAMIAAGAIETSFGDTD